MEIMRVVVGYIHTNCYLLVNEEEKKAVVVDPGWAGDKILEVLEKEGLSLAAVLLTHGHFDHILGLREILPKVEKDGRMVYASDTSGAAFPIMSGEKEVDFLLSTVMNGTEQYRRGMSVIVSDPLKDGEVKEVAGLRFRTILTPGHTAGSACYYFEEEKILLSGDTLFRDSYGRTDFATGDFESIRESIAGKLFCLPDEVEVLPGHGEATTIGREKVCNMIWNSEG